MTKNTLITELFMRGWNIKRIDEFNITLSNKYETWRFSEGSSGDSSDFVYEFLKSILDNGI